MSRRQKIIDKIRKLNAHAESAEAIGNEEEAQAFAAKVQELLTAYKLLMHDISHSGAVQEETINIEYLTWQEIGLRTKRQRVNWVESLAILVGDAYYCEYVISKDWGKIGFYVGTETDREIAKYMFIVLARSLNKIAHHEYGIFFHANLVDGHLPDEARGFKAGFMLGFIRRLRERFNEEIKPKADPAAQAQTQAIVLVKKDALGRAQEWLKNNMKLHKLGGLSMGSSNREGYERGKARANELTLKQNPIEKGAQAAKELK